MRLRKIGLGNPHNSLNGYAGLFFPHCDVTLLYLPNALGMYVDKVTPTEEEAVREHFKQNYRFSSSSIKEMPRGDITSYLFADYSSTIADIDGKTMGDSGVQNRNALLVVTPTVFSDVHHMEYVEVGDYKGCFMEAPVIRGGVPAFECRNAYIEIANGQSGQWDYSDPALSVLGKVITEFETPVHERVLREVLAGTRKEFTGSALCEHLVKNGQTSRW